MELNHCYQLLEINNILFRSGLYLLVGKESKGKIVNCKLDIEYFRLKSGMPRAA